MLMIKMDTEEYWRLVWLIGESDQTARMPWLIEIYIGRNALLQRQYPFGSFSMDTQAGLFTRVIITLSLGSAQILLENTS